MKQMNVIIAEMNMTLREVRNKFPLPYVRMSRKVITRGLSLKNAIFLLSSSKSAFLHAQACPCIYMVISYSDKNCTQLQSYSDKFAITLLDLKENKHFAT